ncbi:MAG TPA: ABC transporter substrate-binding protein [Ramlibacter sp.]|nr:ABC transporter substrate-binding protein [Ramlibacter sp.]
MFKRRFLFQAGLLALAAPSMLHAQAVSGSITVLAYAGIFQDNYVKTVVEPFQRAHPGVKVNYITGSTSAQMLGMVRAQKSDSQIDVAIFDSTLSTIGNAEGLFAKMTPAEVPALNELYPEARIAGDLGPALTYDHMVLVYDTQSVKPAATKLADLWRPDLKGQIAIAAPPSVQGYALTVIAARMLGGDYKQSIDPAIAKFRELAPSVQTFEPNPDTYSLVLNGVVKVGTGWNARAQLFADETKGKLGVATPAEGTVAVMNTINLVQGSKNRAAALAFVNYALSQPAQKAFTERMFYGPTNAKAQIAPAALARTTSSPQVRSRLIPLDWNDIAKVREQWNNRWRREVISAGSR